MSRFLFLNSCSLTVTALAVSLLSIQGCGGGNGGKPLFGNDGGTTTAASKLFVADQGNGAIASLSNSNPTSGAATATRTITGGSTGLGALKDIALDASNDRLYVAENNDVLVFNNASTANGNVAPSRHIVNETLSAVFSSLYLDTANNVLYVGNLGAGARVYNSASTATLSAASRVFNANTTTRVVGVAVDTSTNFAYLLSGLTTGESKIYSFSNASSVNGSVAPTHTIDLSSNDITIGCGIYIDSTNNRLYVSKTTGDIVVYNAASTVSGSITTAPPSRTIRISSLTECAKITVDTVNNRLYALSPDILYILDSASTANGTVAAKNVTILSPGGYSGIAVKP